MKLIILISIALSLSVAAQPSMVSINEFQLEYEVAGQGKLTILLEASEFP